MVIALRPIQDDDFEFLLRVYASTREAELEIVPWSQDAKLAFIRQQFHAQHHHYQTYYSNATFDVVMVNDMAVGRLYVDRWADEIRIVDIAILPERRGEGIGTVLLERVFAEADAAGKPVRINVEVNNPARTLYDRLGFSECGESDGIYLTMERRTVCSSISAS